MFNLEQNKFEYFVAKYFVNKLQLSVASEPLQQESSYSFYIGVLSKGLDYIGLTLLFYCPKHILYRGSSF